MSKSTTKARTAALISRIRDMASTRGDRLRSTTALEIVSTILGRRSSNELVASLKTNAFHIPTIYPEGILVTDEGNQVIFHNSASGNLEFRSDALCETIISLSDGSLAYLARSADLLPVSVMTGAMIHVASVQHKYGANAYAARTEKELDHEIAEYCRQYWSDAVPNEDEPRKDMSDSDIVETYFDENQAEILTKDVTKISSISDRIALTETQTESYSPVDLRPFANPVATFEEEKSGFARIQLQAESGKNFIDLNVLEFDIRNLLINGMAEDIKNALDGETPSNGFDDYVDSLIIHDALPWNGPYYAIVPDEDKILNFYASLGLENLERLEDLNDSMLNLLRFRNADLSREVGESWNNRMSALERFHMQQIRHLRKNRA